VVAEEEEERDGGEWLFQRAAAETKMTRGQYIFEQTNVEKREMK